MIQLQDIWRSYQVGDEQVHALAGIDEEIAEGEHMAIMGPSGSGKSTLLNVIGCLDRPTRGSYVFDGREVARLSEAELSQVRQSSIGYIFQSYHLIKRLDSLGNVELPMTFAGVPRKERRRRASEALESVGLTDRATHRPSELSGGQRQRVAIARAMVMRPRVLLADEPTGNLDSASGAQVLELLDQLNREGLTLITVTHDTKVAGHSRRVLILEDGQIVKRLAGKELAKLAEQLSFISVGS